MILLRKERGERDEREIVYSPWGTREREKEASRHARGVREAPRGARVRHLVFALRERRTTPPPPPPPVAHTHALTHLLSPVKRRLFVRIDRAKKVPLYIFSANTSTLLAFPRLFHASKACVRLRLLEYVEHTEALRIEERKFIKCFYCTGCFWSFLVVRQYVFTGHSAIIITRWGNIFHGWVHVYAIKKKYAAFRHYKIKEIMQNLISDNRYCLREPIFFFITSYRKFHSRCLYWNLTWRRGLRRNCGSKPLPSDRIEKNVVFSSYNFSNQVRTSDVRS